MKKKWIVSIVTISGLITITLIGLGIIFDQEEYEKREGFTSIYDVASDGSIAYVFYEKGKPGIYLENNSKIQSNPIVQLEDTQEILDISFSADEKELAYVVAYKSKEIDLKSVIKVINIESSKMKELVSEKALVTEIEYHPKNEDFIYYLKAQTFENYSPIASARPHDFDLFSYQISSGETTKHTNLKKYMMQSLQVSSTENKAYVSMFDDEHAETADDIFASHQRIFEIPLDNPHSYQVASLKEGNKDIYDFTLTPNEDGFIFQAVNETGDNGIYQYELFHYNRETEEEKQITDLKEHTSNPTLGPDGKVIYFMVDKQFGSRDSDYHLYRMDINNGEVETVPIRHDS
ncbi:PD40 domain-containing protein [Oceanobacillus senegalensis]|uniref:PD40 domain-containing protein n=1 Tax=Oceanobacillus senegalensis TaxID=1936063 RepID=UPI000A30F22B|nr:PD40 domain-containing protein [Oceanobacillus senegalensis]